MEYEAKRIMTVLAACEFCVLKKRCSIEKDWRSIPCDWNTENEEKKLFEIMKENENK